MKKILVIEDEQAVRSGIRDLLELKNYKVFTADSGVEGIKLAEEIIPDLIICDIVMPETNGYEVLKQLKLNENTYTIPFIFLTAKSKMSDLRYGMNMGADDYIIKPFLAADLYKAIDVRLSKREKVIQTSTAPKTGREETESQKHTIEHIFVAEGNNPQFVKINDIECIAAFNEYTNIYLNNSKRLVIRKSLREWESVLPNNMFVRIHRSTIINFEFIDRVEKFYYRSYLIYLKNIKQPFAISQRYYSKLKKYFSF